MKTLSVAVMIIMVFSVMSLITEVHNALGNNDSAFFMKTNSTARIYANFTFPVLDDKTWNMNASILNNIHDPNPINSKDLTIVTNPSSGVANESNIIVTYTITAKNNIKGVYPLFLYNCGLSPLIVGLNESNINTTVFDEFFTATYNCPVEFEDMPKMNLMDYSGIVVKTINTNVNNNTTVYIPNQLPEISSPLKQFKSGIAAKNVVCANGLMLVIKAEDGSPACVTPETANILIERDWAKTS